VSCGNGVFVKSDRIGYHVIACRCRAWRCPDCGPQRRRRVRDEIASGEPTAFLTLTWSLRRNLPPDAARSEMGLAWKHLVARIKRRWPGEEFEYAVVVEKTQRGYPHLHIAFRGPFIPQAWLSEAWCDLTSASIVWIEACNSQGAVAGYLAKYLSKDPTKLGTGKRYWFSQGYRRQDDNGRPAHRPVSRWSWQSDHIVAVVVKLADAGFIPYWMRPDHCVLYRSRAP